MSLISVLGSARAEKLSGKIFIGTVVDNNDPQKLSRIRVRSNDIHDNIDDADLPWLAKNTGTGQGSSSTVGEIAIPVVGSQVAFEFMDESQYYGFYTGSVANTANMHPELTAGNYPHVVGHVDAANNILTNDTSTGDWQFTFKPGTKIHVLPSGEIQVSGASNFTLNVSGNCTINASGNTNLYSTSTVNISGATVNINGGAPPSVVPPTARS